MNKIIPFRKEITFDTMLYEVTSISLEHTLNKHGNVITGTFTVSGEYRVTESSINTLPFNYDLPFTISIDNNYDISNSTMDISDFYYEILDNKSLMINIEVKLENVEELLLERKEVMKNDIDIKNVDVEINNYDNDVVSSNDDIKKSIFSNLDTNDKYVEYKIYIVRESDTIDSIMNKYKVTKDMLEEYNDISSLSIGNKIIIPYVKN